MKKLDESFSYKANAKVLQWEKNTKETVKKNTFKDKGHEDYKKYLLEESMEIQLPEFDSNDVNFQDNDQNFFTMVEDKRKDLKKNLIHYQSYAHNAHKIQKFLTLKKKKTTSILYLPMSVKIMLFLSITLK